MKQYWACVLPDRIKMVGKFETAKEALENAFAYCGNPDTVTATPLGTKKKEAEHQYRHIHNDYEQRRWRNLNATYDLEGNVLRNLLRIINDGSDTKNKFVQNVAERGAAYVVGWDAADCISKEHEAYLANAALRIVRQGGGKNPILAVMDVCGIAKHELIENHFRNNSTDPFQNACQEAKRAGACKFVRHFDCVAGEAERRAKIRQELGMEPIDLEAPYKEEVE